MIISVHSAKFPSEKLTANIREAIIRHGLDHPVVNDPDFRLWQSYAVKAWPTIVVIDPQGKMVHTQSGEIMAAELAPPIQALIDEAEARGTLDRTPLDLQPERGQEPARPLSYPAKLLVTEDNQLYIADTGHHRILEVQLDPGGEAGEIKRVFGSGRPGLQDGPAAEAMFHNPHGLDRRENTLYVADTGNHAIRAINLGDQEVRTIAGTGEKAHGQFRLGRPAETPLRSPWAVLVIDRYLFIAMAGSHQIWVMKDEAEIGPFFGNGREALVDGQAIEASFNQPSDLALGLNHMFVADAEASAIRAIHLAGDPPRVMTLVGQGLFEFGDVDGTGPDVRLQHPTGLTFANNLVFMADSYNHKIKTLDPTTGEVKTLIGTGQPGLADGPLAKAGLFEPEGVVMADGRLYIADTNNHLVRVADLAAGTVNTLTLRGLEKLQSSPAERRPAVRYEPQQVGPGEVTLTFNVELPAGYKLNAEAPQILRLGQEGTENTYTFEPGRQPQVRLPVTASRELNVDLTLYYCQAEAAQLCLIHETRLVVPLVVEEGGPAEVELAYHVPGEV